MLGTFQWWITKLTVLLTNKAPRPKRLLLSTDYLYAIIKISRITLAKWTLQKNRQTKTLKKQSSQSMLPIFFSPLGFSQFRLTVIFVICPKSLLNIEQIGLCSKPNIPLSLLREKYENQFWIKNKFYFKNYCSWYKITQEFENLIPLQWEQSHFLKWVSMAGCGLIVLQELAKLSSSVINARMWQGVRAHYFFLIFGYIICFSFTVFTIHQESFWEKKRVGVSSDSCKELFTK